KVLPVGMSFFMVLMLCAMPNMAMTHEGAKNSTDQRRIDCKAVLAPGSVINFIENGAWTRKAIAPRIYDQTRCLSYQVAPNREQLGMTATRRRCPQVFENTGFARVFKNFCVSRLIPIKRNLVSGDVVLPSAIRMPRNTYAQLLPTIAQMWPPLKISFTVTILQAVAQSVLLGACANNIVVQLFIIQCKFQQVCNQLLATKEGATTVASTTLTTDN
ncbi:MAG: hypothetical protein FWG02_11395, partial [Holophagaceae bacterium]|nr:hypothetical protein [Holophagaceae bacterium]